MRRVVLFAGEVVATAFYAVPGRWMLMPHRTLSLKEVAAHLHLPVARVEELLRNGDIPHEKSGTRLVFRKRELDAWASKNILGMGAKRLSEYHRESATNQDSGTGRKALIPHVLCPSQCEPALRSRTRHGVLSDLVEMAEATGKLNDPKALLESLEERERQCATALAGGVAMPHPATHDPYLFEDSFLVVARTIQPVPFGAPDGQTTDLFLLVCCKDDRLHLQMLARLCMICHHTPALIHLREAVDAAALYETLCAAESKVL